MISKLLELEIEDELHGEEEEEFQDDAYEYGYDEEGMTMSEYEEIHGPKDPTSIQEPDLTPIQEMVLRERSKHLHSFSTLNRSD